MTISSTSRQAGPYAGNGVTVALPFAFKVFATTDVRVVSTDPSGISTEKTLGTEFSVTLNSDQDVSPGGAVTMIVAPAVGYSTTITSKVPALQSMDLTSGGNFYPQSIENALDKVTVLVQQALIDVETAALANPAAWSSSLGAADGSKLVGFVQPDSGAVQRSVLQKLRDKVSSADFNTYVASSDNTGALQAAIDAVQARAGITSGGDVIEIPAGTHTFLGKINITKSFVRLVGKGKQSTLLNFQNGSSDCIVIDGTLANGSNLRDVTVEDLAITSSGKTAGAYLKFINTYRCGIRNIYTEHGVTHVDVGPGTNDTFLERCTLVPDGAAALHGIYWHCPGDGSARSDALTIRNVVIEGLWSDATCFLWEGFCNTASITELRMEHAKYGLRVINPAGSAAYYPMFCNATDMEGEGFKNRALSIEAGVSFKLVGCDFNNLTGGAAGQGNADDYAIAILPDTGASATRSIQISDSRVGFCRQAGIYTNAWDIQLSNLIMVSTSMAAVGGAPSIKVDTNSRSVQMCNIRGEEYGGAGRSSYAVQVENGALDIQLANIDGTYCQTGAVNNLSNSGTVGIVGTIEPGSVGSNLISYGNTDVRLQKSVSGTAYGFTSYNASSSNNSIARIQWSTGLANANVIADLNNAAAAPVFNVSGGSAMVSCAFTFPKHYWVIGGNIAFSIGAPLGNYANDAAAAAGNVPLYGYYRNGGLVQQRVV